MEYTRGASWNNYIETENLKVYQLDRYYVVIPL